MQKAITRAALDDAIGNFDEKIQLAMKSFADLFKNDPADAKKTLDQVSSMVERRAALTELLSLVGEPAIEPTALTQSQPVIHTSTETFKPFSLAEGAKECGVSESTMSLAQQVLASGDQKLLANIGNLSQTEIQRLLDCKEDYTPISHYCYAILCVLENGHFESRQNIRENVLRYIQSDAREGDSALKSHGRPRYETMWQNALHRILPNMGMICRVRPATYQITAKGIKALRSGEYAVQKYPQFKKA